MDSLRFDALARALGSSASRRAALRGSVAAAVGALGLADLEAGEARKRRKKRCGKCARRKHGHCRAKPDRISCGDNKLCENGRCKACTPDAGACVIGHAEECCSGGCCYFTEAPCPAGVEYCCCH